jgi:hypothetical protein
LLLACFPKPLSIEGSLEKSRYSDSDTTSQAISFADRMYGIRSFD